MVSDLLAAAVMLKVRVTSHNIKKNAFNMFFFFEKQQKSTQCSFRVFIAPFFPHQKVYKIALSFFPLWAAIYDWLQHWAREKLQTLHVHYQIRLQTSIIQRNMYSLIKSNEVMMNYNRFGEKISSIPFRGRVLLRWLILKRRVCWVNLYLQNINR